MMNGSALYVYRKTRTTSHTGTNAAWYCLSSIQQCYFFFVLFFFMLFFLHMIIIMFISFIYFHWYTSYHSSSFHTISVTFPSIYLSSSFISEVLLHSPASTNNTITWISYFECIHFFLNLSPLFSLYFFFLFSFFSHVLYYVWVQVKQLKIIF